MTPTELQTILHETLGIYGCRIISPKAVGYYHQDTAEVLIELGFEVKFEYPHEDAVTPNFFKIPLNEHNISVAEKLK